MLIDHVFAERRNVKWCGLRKWEVVVEDATKMLLEIIIIWRDAVFVPVENWFPCFEHHLVQLFVFGDKAISYLEAWSDVGVLIFQPFVRLLLGSSPIINKSLSVSMEAFLNGLLLQSLYSVLKSVK